MLSEASILIKESDDDQALPLVLQLGLFATPVAYGFATLEDRVGTWYAAFNPFVGVIESYRACVVGGRRRRGTCSARVPLGAVVWFVVGAVIFKRFEVGIADVA